MADERQFTQAQSHMMYATLKNIEANMPKSDVQPTEQDRWLAWNAGNFARTVLSEIDSQDDGTQDARPKFVARGSNKTGWFIIHFNTGIPYSLSSYESYDDARDAAAKLNAQVQS